jgi:hypothetical protein
LYIKGRFVARQIGVFFSNKLFILALRIGISTIAGLKPRALDSELTTLMKIREDQNDDCKLKVVSLRARSAYAYQINIHPGALQIGIASVPGPKPGQLRI